MGCFPPVRLGDTDYFLESCRLCIIVLDGNILGRNWSCTEDASRGQYHNSDYFECIPKETQRQETVSVYGVTHPYVLTTA